MVDWAKKAVTHSSAHAHIHTIEELEVKVKGEQVKPLESREQTGFV